MKLHNSTLRAERRRTVDKQQPAKILSAAEIEHFLRRGHVVLKGCFPRETAKEWTDNFWARGLRSWRSCDLERETCASARFPER